MASNNSIQVAIKLRPLLGKEKDMPCWQVKNDMISLEGQSEPYRFDYVFDKNTTNYEVFEKMAKHIVHEAVKGYNGTIFAYGQTSSGKTYTMFGEDNDPGVMVLSAKEIFSEIKKTSKTRQFLLRGGFIEIHNEKIYDLLSKKNQELKIHEMANGIPGVNCEETCITNEDQLIKLLINGNKQRTVGETMMNERSSRSHAIFRLIIESKDIDSAEDGAVKQSVLFLVDLAGSERADQTGARGARLKEGGHINKSLLFLSNVIKRLSENEDAYICFRESKLTRILQPSLGGNAFTSIICTVKSTAIEETQSTLNFATRAKRIKNKPHVNETVPDATMMKRLTNEIKVLRRQLEEEKQRNTSQIKLSKIKELLDYTELKIINSSTLQSSRSMNDNRRRTWSADTCLGSNMSTSLFEPLPTTGSLLRPPNKNVYYTPNIFIRRNAAEIVAPTQAPQLPPPQSRTPSPPSRMDIVEEAEEEEFVAANNFDFGTLPKVISPKLKLPGSDNILKHSISPTAKNTSVYVKMLEEELRSLQEFTNLENSVGVQHDHYESLKATLNELCKRNEELERDHIHYIILKDDIDFYKGQYEKSSQRCNELEIQIAKLTNANVLANQKIEQYESELSNLKASIKRLEIENCEAVSLQFEFESHRNKTKSREKELLDLLEERDAEKAKLQQQIQNLKTEELHNSKEKLMRLTRCNCSNGTTEHNGGNSSEHLNGVGSGTETAVNACTNCEELQRVLEENKKITLEFDKLRLQYQELELSYKKSTTIVEHETRITNECEELRNEIVVLRQRLEIVEHEYDDVKNERDEKSDRCESLNREVEAAQQEIHRLQEKFGNLENIWQSQEEALANIRIEYETLEKKYNQLQQSYDEVENSNTKCSADCERLLSENDSLQSEIQKLKTRIEKMQQQLLDGLVQQQDAAETNATERTSIDENDRVQTDCMRAELKNMEDKYNQLQQEYDELSTTLMDNLQENETLRSTCQSLEVGLEELKKQQLENIEKLNLHSIELADRRSVHDQQLFESVNEIMLKESSGKERIFIAKDFIEGDDKDETESVKHYRLSLENWRSKFGDDELDYKNLNDDTEFGLLKAFISTAKHLENGNFSKAQEASLRAVINDLQEEVRVLKDKNASMYESSQQSIKEMRNEIVTLTAELLEKSSVLENCSCIEYQKQIEELIKDKNELTLLNVELQEKMTNSYCGGESNSSSNISSPNKTILHDKNAGATVENQENCESMTIEEKYKCLEMKLKEKERECQRLQLEQLEKLALAEDEFRKNMRKYNEDWEEKRLEFEQKINELQRALEATRDLKQECEEDINEVEEPMEENMTCDIEERLQDIEKNSTPTNQTERYLEAQQIREERYQIVTACNEKITMLSVMIDEKKAINLELMEALAEKDNLIVEKDIEIEKLRDGMKEIELELLSLKTVACSNGDHAGLKVSLEVTQRESMKLKEQYELLMEENVVLNEKIKDLELLRVEFGVMEVEVTELKQRCESLEKEKVLLVEEVKLLKAQLEETKQETVKLKARCECLESEKALPAREVQMLKTQIEEWKCEAMDLESRCEGLEKEKLVLVEDVKELKAQLEEAKFETGKLKSRCECLETEKALPNEEVQKLTVQLEECKDEAAKVKSRFECWNNEYNLLTGKAAELDTLKKVLQEACEEIIQWKEECEDLIMKTIADKKLNEDQLNSIIKELPRSAFKKITDFPVENSDKFAQSLDELFVKFIGLVQEFNKQQRDMIDCQETCRDMLIEKTALQTKIDENLKLRLEAEEELNILKLFKSELTAANTQLTNDKNSLEQENNKLQATLKPLDELTQEHANLRSEMKSMEIKFAEKEATLQQQVKDLNQELESCMIARKSNVEISVLNKEITQQLNALKIQGVHYDKMKMENEILEGKLRAVENEKSVLNVEIIKVRSELQVLKEHNANKLKSDNEKFEKLQIELRELKTELEAKIQSFKEERKRFENTISCLQMDNKNLSERLELTNEIIKKRADVCESANSSIEYGSHGSNSPHSRKSPIKSSANSSIDDKLSVIQKERKNRRLSTHDENRRQSSQFVPLVQDKGTMTQQSTESCECAELREKLQECETQLCIRKSQVTALNLQIRNHPLKQENSTLFKRIEKEQEKNAESNKRYKNKIDELTKKINALQAEVISAAQVPKVVRYDSGTCTSPQKRRTVTEIETQTEFEMDFCLQKLQGKYNDLKQMCRYRYTQIADLTRKLEEKENMVTGNSGNQQQKVPNAGEKLKLKKETK